MRRLMSIAAFALLLAVPVWAQHGGGHGGGGGHAGFSGGHGGFAGHAGGGFVGGGHFSGGARGGFSRGPSGGFSRSPRGVFSRGFNHSFNQSFHHNSFRGNRGFRRHRDHDFDDFVLRNNCYGWGCRWGYSYPWWNAGYYYPYYPWWWDEDDRRFDEDYYRQYDIANQMNEQSLAQQRMLREEEAAGDQDAYAPRRSERAANPAPDGQGDPIIARTVLVFRDQHQQEISNYAIVGQTLWNFASQHTQKIALADLDLVATEKANDDRGISFRVPGTNEGQ